MLLRLLTLFAILWFVGKILRLIAKGSKKSGVEQSASTLVRDPSCGVYFDPRSAVQTLSKDGEKIFFCSQDCYEKFLKGTSSDGNTGTGQKVS